jgi:hypothetical protein
MKLRTVTSHSAVAPAAWDALAGQDDPFLEHAFLYTLEETGCVGKGTGWEPQYLLCEEGDSLLGAVPLYLKFHSYGEYIFDWGWASAAQRARLRYYPKLTAAVPFTPATGRRLLLHPGADAARVTQALIGGLLQSADDLQASSVHALFVTEGERAALAARGFLPRLTSQFHWENRGYTDFENYLAAFRSSARKQTRKERKQAAASGLRLHTKRGPELSSLEWRSLYDFYRSTASDKGAIPYLTEEFFLALPQRLSPRVVVALASRGEVPVAGALAFQKGSQLFGRYWGSTEEHDALHFELCYYQLIDFAIQHKLSRFEAGAQGEHKLKRGFLPAPIYSAHWLRHPGLSQAIGDYLARESMAVQAEIAELREHGPFAQRDAGEPAP